MTQKQSAEDHANAILERMLQQAVGDYTGMKHLEGKLHEEMQKLALGEIMHNAVVGDDSETRKYVQDCLKHKKKYELTALYLYCNWRVWRLYKEREDLAMLYQKVCDFIDGVIFSEWKDTDELAYFIRETD